MCSFIDRDFFNFEMFLYSELRQFELVLQEHPDYKITCMIKFASEMSPGISEEWLNTIWQELGVASYLALSTCIWNRGVIQMRLYAKSKNSPSNIYFSFSHPFWLLYLLQNVIAVSTDWTLYLEASFNPYNFQLL